MQIIVKHITSLLLLVTLFHGFQANDISNSLDWMLDIEMAKERAKKENKPILISFAGSDWCKPCIILTKEVFNNEDFSLYANDNLILVLADFPRYKKNRLPDNQVKKNEKLAKKYNNEGAFPLVVLVDANGEIIGKPTYQGEGAEQYITHLKTLLANQQ